MSNQFDPVRAASELDTQIRWKPGHNVEEEACA